MFWRLIFLRLNHHENSYILLALHPIIIIPLMMNRSLILLKPTHLHKFITSIQYQTLINLGLRVAILLWATAGMPIMRTRGVVPSSRANPYFTIEFCLFCLAHGKSAKQLGSCIGCEDIHTTFFSIFFTIQNKFKLYLK
jgi:hypothetical protein